MPCSDIIEKTKTYYQDLKTARKKLSASSVVCVNNQDERNTYEELATRWFSDFSKSLISYGIDKETLHKYNSLFKSILKLCSGLNRRTSYAKTFDVILKDFNDEIVIFIQTDAVELEEVNVHELGPEVIDLLSKISDKD